MHGSVGDSLQPEGITRADFPEVKNRLNQLGEVMSQSNGNIEVHEGGNERTVSPYGPFDDLHGRLLRDIRRCQGHSGYGLRHRTLDSD
jgi:hypothetical protein